MKILLATGIYPPHIGGPAQYAKNLNREWTLAGHQVKVKTYGIERSLPTGIRHLYFLLKIIPAVIWCDFIFALDTYSVGLPAALASKFFHKTLIIRTGGDFLWEGFTERTGDKVLLRNFYSSSISRLNLKEKIIFKLTKWTLKNTDKLIFSTSWQRNIWAKPYDINLAKTFIVENYYGAKEASFKPDKKNFIGGARPLKWKNTAILKEVFNQEDIFKLGAIYESDNAPHEVFMNNIAHAYAILLVSLGDISPNMILDSIRHNKPFIMTKENGLLDRISDISITVDPLDKEDIKAKVLWLCDDRNYEEQCRKIENFNFVHTWNDIANEIIDICKAN